MHAFSGSLQNNISIEAKLKHSGFQAMIKCHQKKERRNRRDIPKIDCNKEPGKDCM
jgi:hypothetical protein